MADNLTRREAQLRAAILSVEGYDVDLDLTAGDSTFMSRTSVQFACREPGSTTFIELAAQEVQEITLNGRSLNPGQVVQGNRITLTDLEAHNRLEVIAHCAYSKTGEGLHRFVDPVDKGVYLYTQFETYDAHRVLACFDQPDLKAPWTLQVTAPEDWVCVSNAPGISEPAQGREGCLRWEFRLPVAISTYLYALVAGPYHHVHEVHTSAGVQIPLGLYCRASLAQFLDPDELFALTRAGFDFFHELFGVAYPFGKYDQLFVPEFNAGAMENVGAVTFLEDYVFRSKVTRARRERRAETLLHEMAHMWFGDLVTMRWWDDLWLNESFATYVSVHAQVQATDYTDGWTTFANSEKTWALRQDQLSSTHPVVADAFDMEAVKTNFDGITYAKGAALLKQLVAWVGQDEFYAGLRAYFAEHAWGNTDLADLLRHLGEASGRDLSEWRDDWLLTTGVNTLRPKFTARDGHYESFTIEQSAEPTHPRLRPHRIAIGLYDRENDRLIRRERVELDVSGPQTHVTKLIDLPTADLVLLNDDDLTFAKIRLDADSWRTVVSSIGDIDDSLARALCWGAAWDMTRDAEVPAGQFLDLVLGGVSRESDVGIVQRLFGQARTAVLQFGIPERQTQRLARLADRARELADAAEPGGDHQLVFVLSAAAAAVTDQQVSWLTGILDGSAPPSGLTVDADLRWALISRLAILGRIGEAQIDAELERDRTASGEKQAALSRAALPELAAKEAAWQSVVEHDLLSNHVAAATMVGFNQPEQSALLAPFAPRFFDAVEHIWAVRSSESAQHLTELLFPAWDVSTTGLARVEAMLSRELTPALRRCLLEGRDGVTRALRCRAQDA